MRSIFYPINVSLKSSLWCKWMEEKSEREKVRERRRGREIERERKNLLTMKWQMKRVTFWSSTNIEHTRTSLWFCSFTFNPLFLFSSTSFFSLSLLFSYLSFFPTREKEGKEIESSEMLHFQKRKMGIRKVFNFVASVEMCERIRQERKEKGREKKVSEKRKRRVGSKLKSKPCMRHVENFL